MATSNALCNSWKVETMQGGHVFASTVTPLVSMSNGAYVTNSISSLSGIVVGMTASGAGIQNGTTVAAMNATTVTFSLPVTAPLVAQTVTMTGDQFYLALFAGTTVGGYGANTTNYSQMGSDEVTGSGYTAGGVLVTDVTPTLSGNTAMVTFGSNPSWGVSTFTYSAALLYNATARIGGVSGRSVAVFDFGGSHVVTGSPLTLILPAVTSTTALIRVQ